MADDQESDYRRRVRETQDETSTADEETARRPPGEQPERPEDEPPEPPEPAEDDEDLDEVNRRSAESFPSSDPPPSSGGGRR